MKLFKLFTAAALAASACAHAEPIELVSLPSVQVLAVQPSSAKPADYAQAYGKLAGYTSQAKSVKVVSPQMSLALHNSDYAAIAVQGQAAGSSDVRVLSLPACQFVTRKYVGDYAGIRPAVQDLIAEAFQDGYMMDAGCGVRVLHRSGSDAADKHIHEIFVPVTKKLS